MEIVIRNALKSAVLNNSRVLTDPAFLDRVASDCSILTVIGKGSHIASNSLLLVSPDAIDEALPYLIEKQIPAVAIPIIAAFPEIDRGLVEFCNQHQINVIELSGEYPYSKIIEYFSNHIYIERIGEFLSIEELSKKFSYCICRDGFKNILSLVYKYLGRPAAIAVSTTVYAVGDPKLMQSIVNLDAESKYLSESKRFQVNKDASLQFHYCHEITQDNSPGSQHWLRRTFNNPYYRFFIAEGDAPFSGTDLQILYFAITACALQIHIHEQDFINQMQASRLLFKQLISESIEPAEVENFGWNLGSKNTVAIAYAPVSFRQMQHFQEVLCSELKLRNLISNIPMIKLGKRLAVIFSDITSEETASSVLEATMNTLKITEYQIGISDMLENSNIGTAYRQAETALRFATLFAGTQMRFYTKMGVASLLMQLPRNELENYYLRSLSPILELDPEKRNDLLSTLECYLNLNCNVTTVAGKTHLHANTIRYRMQRVQELLNVDIKDINVLIDLQTALIAKRIAETLYVKP